ncbi:hypothetical protein, conserved [Plasmodium gonderi]|uniref:MORN repeat protein n=1 Tax=Plasmodium gonderi TaxID=77519 RepID=A0A1Y1JS36_PLAGO|nr:hypothetical protein, conserved [Plasmodium gonderi]GAW83273.1 hypothetical protein, conserved [Plasmodium gonderi]
MIKRLFSIFVITGILICTHFSFQHDLTVMQNLFKKDSFTIYVENKEECALKYDTLKTNFRHVYLVLCEAHATNVEIRFMNILQVKRGKDVQNVVSKQNCNKSRKTEIIFFNERNKQITKDNIVLKFKNTKKVNYKLCQMENPKRCIIIYVIISFKFDVMDLKELLVNNLLTQNEDGKKLNLLHPENVTVINKNEYFRQHILMDSKKIRQFYEININVKDDNQPLYVYTSSHPSNFVYINKNLRNLLKEENYKYETYFYKFICTDNLQLFAGTSDIKREQFIIYRLNITCSDRDKNNFNPIFDISVIGYSFHVPSNGLDKTIMDPTFIMPKFLINTFRYDIFTPSDNFWLRVKIPNNSVSLNNFSVNDKKLVHEYNLITLNEYLDEYFYDECIDEWKYLHSLNSVNHCEDISNMKKRNSYLIFGNMHDEDLTKSKKNYVTNLFDETINIETFSWKNLFSSKRKKKLRNYQEIDKVIFPTKKVFILKYTNEEKCKDVNCLTDPLKCKINVSHYFFYIHKIPANIIASSFTFIAFLKNANCSQNNICTLQNGRESSYIQVVFKKKQNKKWSFLDTNFLLTQKSSRFHYYDDKRDNLNLFINNKKITDDTEYSISEIGKREENINIKILDDNKNILYNTDLVIIRKNVFYKFFLQFLSYFSYAYIILFSCLQSSQLLPSIQFIQILTFLNIKYDTFLPSLYHYFLKKLQILSFISYIVNVNVYRKIKTNHVLTDLQHIGEGKKMECNAFMHAHSKNYDHNTSNSVTKEEINFVKSENGYHYSGKLNKSDNTDKENHNTNKNVEKSMQCRIKKGDNLQNNNCSMEKENITTRGFLNKFILFRGSKKYTDEEENKMKKKYIYQKNQETIYKSSGKLEKDEIFLLHIYVSVLLNIIIMLFLFTLLYFVYSKYTRKGDTAKIIIIPFLSFHNFIPLMFDIFLFPIIYSTSNIIHYDSIYQVKVYFLTMDISTVKFVCTILLVCYILSYIFLSLYFILYVKKNTTYSYYLQRFIPLSINKIHGIIIQRFPFQFLFKKYFDIHLPSYTILLRSNEREKYSPNDANVNHHINITKKVDQGEVNRYAFSSSPYRLNEIKNHVSKNNISLKKIIRNYINRKRREKIRTQLSQKNQLLLQDMPLAVSTVMDTHKKEGVRLSSKNQFFQKNISQDRIAASSDGDADGDSLDDVDRDSLDDVDGSTDNTFTNSSKNEPEQDNLINVFKKTFYIIDNHIRHNELVDPLFYMNRSYVTNEKFQTEITYLRENEILNFEINKQICKFLRIENKREYFDIQIERPIKIMIHDREEDKKWNLGIYAEKFHAKCLTNYISKFLLMKKRINRCKNKFSFDNVVKSDVYRNKLLRIMIDRKFLNSNSINSCNHEEKTNTHLLAHEERIKIGYLYDKISLFKKKFYFKKIVELKHLYILLSQKRKLQLFVSNKHIYNGSCGIFSLFLNNWFNENILHFLYLRLMTVTWILTTNLLICKSVHSTFFSLSIFFFAIFLYNFSSTVNQIDKAISKNKLGEPNSYVIFWKNNKEMHKNDKRRYKKRSCNIKSFAEDIPLSADSDNDDTRQNFKSFSCSKKEIDRTWIHEDMLKYQVKYSELILSMILLLLFLSNILGKKEEQSEMFSFLLILLTISLYINLLTLKNSFYKIIAHVKHFLEAKWHSVYVKIYALYFLYIIEHLCNFFMQCVITLSSKNKTDEFLTQRSDPRMNDCRNIFSYFSTKILHNTNGMTFKNVVVDKIEIHYKEKDINYKYETLTLIDKPKNVFYPNLRKNLYFIGKIDLMKFPKDKIANVPIFINNEMRKNRNYYIGSIEIIGEENVHSTKSLSLFIKKKSTKKNKIQVLRYSKNGDLLCSSKIVRKKIPLFYSIPKKDKFTFEGTQNYIEKQNRDHNTTINSTIKYNGKKKKTHYLHHQKCKRIKIDKFSYTVISKNTLTIHSLFIKPQRTYKIQPVFKKKHLDNMNSCYVRKSKSANLFHDNFKEFSNYHQPNWNTNGPFTKYQKNVNSYMEPTNSEKLSYESKNHISLYSAQNREYICRNANKIPLFNNGSHSPPYKEKRKFQRDENLHVFRVTCEDIGIIIVSHNINYIDTFDDINVVNEFGETFCLNIHCNCITFIKKKKIIIIKHPCFYKNEEYRVYLRDNKKYQYNYINKEIYMKSTHNGEIILNTFRQNDVLNIDNLKNRQNDTEKINNTEQHFNCENAIPFGDHVHMYKVNDYKSRKYIFVKVNTKNNTFYAQNYSRTECENKFDVASIRRLFCRENNKQNCKQNYKQNYQKKQIEQKQQQKQPIDDFLDEINQTDFVPIQLLYKIKTHSDVALVKYLQNYFVRCICERPIICKGDNKGNSSGNVPYELLSTSEGSIETSVIKPNWQITIRKMFTKKSLSHMIWRNKPYYILSKDKKKNLNLFNITSNNSIRSDANSCVNYFKDYPTNWRSKNNIISNSKHKKKNEQIIFKKGGYSLRKRNYNWKYLLHNLYKKCFNQNKKRRVEIFYRYVVDYKNLIKTYSTNIKIYESKYNYVKHNKGNIKMLANILMESLNIPYILDVFQKYDIIDKKENNNTQYYMNNINFNIYDIYEKCSLNKKHIVSKIVNYLEELAAYKFMYIITYYKDKLNCLHLWDKISNDKRICEIQKNIDQMFYDKFCFIGREVRKFRVQIGQPGYKVGCTSGCYSSDAIIKSVSSAYTNAHGSSSFSNDDQHISNAYKVNQRTNEIKKNKDVLKNAQNRNTHDKTLVDAIVERYIKGKKSFAKKFYKIKKNIREIAKKYKEEEEEIKKILFHFPFFINKNDIINMKKNVEQQIYAWNSCLTVFFSNFLSNSLTNSKICYYNIRILNKHILNSIKHAIFNKNNFTSNYHTNFNFVHVIISLPFINPQKTFLLSPTFFYMKYLAHKPIFSLCNHDEIGNLLRRNDRKPYQVGIQEVEVRVKVEDQVEGGRKQERGESTGTKNEHGKRKKIHRKKNKVCTIPRKKKKNAPTSEKNIFLGETNLEENKLLPCYIEIINGHLFLYLFDNYDNKICWKIEKGNYSLKTKEPASKKGRNCERDENYEIRGIKATGTMNTNEEISKQETYFLEEQHINCNLSDSEKREVQCTITSIEEKDELSFSSFNQSDEKKKKKYTQSYTLLERKIEDKEMNRNHIKSKLNCFVKCVSNLSILFNNIRDGFRNILCIFFTCNEEVEKNMQNNNSECINLLVKINPNIIPQLSSALTINDCTCENLTERNKLLIHQKIEKVCLDGTNIIKHNGMEREHGKPEKGEPEEGEPTEVEPKEGEPEEIDTHSALSKGNICCIPKGMCIWPEIPSKNSNLKNCSKLEYFYTSDVELSKRTFSRGTHINKKKSEDSDWYELNLFTYNFYKNKISELIKNYKNSIEMKSNNSDGKCTNETEIHTYQDLNLDKTEKRNTTNESWSYDQINDASEKEYDVRKEEQRNISYLLKGIERMRTTTFINKNFMEDSTKSIHKELIFCDKNQELFCKYVGDMKNKFYNGKGKLYDKYNSLIYDGEWINSEKHGKGKLLFKYFNIWYLYEGEFLRDEIIGKGVISLIDKEYVKGIQSNKINKLCPLLIKANFGKHKDVKTRKDENKENYSQLSNKLIKQIEKTVMANYSSTNNVDFWPKEITEIYFPYLKKWNIYSFYCSSNIENIKRKKEIFESNDNNYKNLIGYPSFEIRNGHNDFASKGSDQNILPQGEADTTVHQKKLHMENQSNGEPQSQCNNNNPQFVSQKHLNDYQDVKEDIIYKRDKTNILHEKFFEYMKKKNEQKLYYPLLSKHVGIAKIIYADKSEYIGPINNRGQPNTNGEFPKAIFNNDNFFYEGEMKNLLPHGYGIFKNKNDSKNTYLGFWKNGYREGSGSLNLRNKKYIIQAKFLKDKLHNNINIYIKDEKISKIHLSNMNKNFQKIKIFFRNGYVFYGQFSKNYQRNGIGILIDSNNKILYHGYYKNDVIDKFCYILRHKDNTIYCGNLQQGMKKGFGKLYYEEKLHFNDENDFNLSLSNAKILARKLESYDGIDINSDIPLKFAFDSNHIIYIGYWDANTFSHFGSCNLRNGFYKGDIKESKKDGFGIYIYKNKKSYKNKNRYVLSYFKKDKMNNMGKYYSEYDKLKVHSFQKEQIKRKRSNYDNCFNKGKIHYDVLKTDKLYINQKLDYYITMPLGDMLSDIMNEVWDKSTSFVNYLYSPFDFNLNYFLKK